MATVFMPKITQRIYESPAQSAAQKVATQLATKRFDVAVDELKDGFEHSLVTEEIDRGVGSPNISHTLRGGDASENLFSFIGFDASDEPTKEIRDRLEPGNEDGPKLRLRGKELRGTAIRYQFVVDPPNAEEIYRATPIPWADSLSWAEKIESDIPGFASFLARPGAGNSEGGIQAKKADGTPQILRDASYTPPTEGYLQTLFRKFVESLRQ